MIDSEVEDTKKKLWDNLNKKNSIDLTNNSLQRLLTFIEMPSFIKEKTKTNTILPKISRDASLVSQNAILSYKNENLKRFSFLQSDNSSISNKNRLGHFEFKSIINIIIEIDHEKGFMQITPEVAVGLRQLTYGSLKQSFSEEWRNAYFSFKDISGSLGYSLFSEKNASRGLQICVQAYFLKNLLYTINTTNESRSRLLNVTENRRLDCLARSLAEILWKVGDQRKAYVCLLSNEYYVDQTHFYICDKITEKIHIFKFKSSDLLRSFLKNHIKEFTSRGSNGCILFLYSLVLSKGFQELFEDFDFDCDKSLLTFNETLEQRAVNLILTGHAVDHLHNGLIYYDESNHYLSKPQHGIKERSEIGYLQYNSPEDADYFSIVSKIGRRASDSQISSQTDMEQLNVVGSMLKTPKYPIWITNGNGNIGIIFSLRDDLLSHWRAENNFILHYMNLLPSQAEPCLLSITTRRGRTAKFKTALLLREENKKIPLLNHIINTKWFGCRVDWNKSMTFI